MALDQAKTEVPPPRSFRELVLALDKAEQTGQAGEALRVAIGLGEVPEEALELAIEWYAWDCAHLTNLHQRITIASTPAQRRIVGRALSALDDLIEWARAAS